MIHCAHELPTVVGDDVIVGHAAMLEGCVVEDGALVGMGAIVLQRARLGAGAMLAAGAVLAERREIGPGDARGRRPGASRRSRCRAPAPALDARPPPAEYQELSATAT